MIVPHAKNTLLSGWLVWLRTTTRFGQRQVVKVRGMAGSAGQTNDPWITATPRVCLHDVPTFLKAGGLTPHSPITLSASLTDESGREFCSCAHYVTDSAGNVDVRTAESVGGSYEGVFPAGLLTTLVPAPHEVPSLRLYRRDPSLPWKIQVSVLAAHQPLGARAKPMAKVNLERHLMAPGVRRLPVREGRVRGVLYLPTGDGRFPGVVDMFGSVGGIMEFRSAMLASRGFASLALAYFAHDDLPATTDHIDLDYFEEAVNVLLAVPEVIPDRCGAVAISKSGDILLSMATLLPAVKAVVAISSLTFVLHSRMVYKGEIFRQGVEAQNYLLKTEQDTVSGSLQHLFTNDNPAMIPVEEADDDTHFLVVAGDDDPWGFKHSLAPFRERMLSHNKHNFETVLYPGTGHLIEPPYGPLISQSFHRHLPGESKYPRGTVMEWGGQPQSTCTAQEDLWRRMQSFLMNHVRDESSWYQQHLARHASHITSKL